MAFNKLNNLESLEEQIFTHKPTLKTKEQKENVRKRLRHQLVDSKAIVRIQRMDAECESLMISLKQRLQVLQDFLIPKEKREQAIMIQEQKNNKDDFLEEIVKINLSSDSSDEETLSSLISNRREVAKSKSKLHKKSRTCLRNQQADLSENTDTELPLALRRKPRERTLSYKSLSRSVSTSHSKHQRNKLQHKEDHSVTTSGVAYHSDDLLVEEEEVNATPTLHIKIPSLHRGNVHYIILDSVNFARKVFDYRANEVRLQQQHQQQQQHSSITHSTKISKTRKKQIKTTTADHPILQQLSQQEHELELSQLIQNVMAEACTDETLQATNALENINNNLIDNYESISQENFITYSQTSQEISYSQNSNIIETSSFKKKQCKNKRTAEPSGQQLNQQPPRKKGRKPKKKNEVNVLEVQPPTKSNLAKYVECFSNDCELMPGSTTPAASSTRSLPLVSSTTQNFEVVDQLLQRQGQQTSPPQQQQPITYYIDGDWANGGPCQLVATSMYLDAKQLNQDDVNAPFQDFVNYIDNNGDSGNNVIARVLEANHGLPISIPLPIANLGIQNKTLQHNPQSRQQIIPNSVPVINIQIPSLPNTITTPTAPPPAHKHKDVLDLSIKSNSNFNINSNEVLNLHKSYNTQNSSAFMADRANDDDDDYDCIPLDLSAKGCNATTNVRNITIDNQDEEFIRRLIEQSDYEYANEALKKADNTRNDLIYDHDSEKSFKAGLDMPLLDFDANDLAVLVENNSTETNKQLESVKDTCNEDSNYVSMTAGNTALHFSDQTTSEIITKLLDICPDNQFLDINNEFTTNDDLNESMFDQWSVKNSTMCEMPTTKKPEEKEMCDTTSKDNEKTNNEHDSSNETSISTSLEVQINSSNNVSVTSEVSLNIKSSINKDKSNKSKTRMENVEKGNTHNLNEKEVIQINEKNSITHKSKEVISTIKSKKTSNDNTSQIDTLESSKSLKSDQQNGNKQNYETQLPQDLEMIYISTILNNSEDKNRGIKQDIQTSCYANNSKKGDDCIKLNEHKLIVLKDTKNEVNDVKINENKNIDLKDSKNNINNKSDNTLMINQAKDNVVFSVKKITLTEDESIFTTDSDASSGKSFDMNYNKPQKRDNYETISILKNQNIEIKRKENEIPCTKNNVDEKDVMEIENDQNENINLKTLVNENQKKSCEPNENNDSITKPIESNKDNSTEVVNLKILTNENDNFCETNEEDENNDDDTLILKESESFCSEVINLSVTSKLENNSESSTQDLLICNLDDKDSNATHESTIAAGKDLNCTNDQLQKNDKRKLFNSNDLNITSQNLTLLELESKLEGSLDFEEDYDDTLSLATSCFNSPNDERFEDSIVINDTETTTVTTTKPIETKNNINDNQYSTTTNKDLKYFKIPKITQLTSKDNNTNEILTENETLIINKSPTPTIKIKTPINSLPKTATDPINLEKIIRTVKNDLVETIPNSLDVASISEIQHEVAIKSKIIQQVFGITCLPFLVNRCFAITHCQLSHQFYDTDTVYQHLNTLDKSNVNVIYQILYNHTKLFKLYFKVFCSYYTTKNDRVKLLNMVNDCERYPEYGGEFLIAIYESLVNCGLNRVNACRLILKRIRETTSANAIIEALVAIIMKSDWTMFTDFIEKYTQEVYKYNYRITILEQMAPAVLNSKGPHLKQIFGKCVQTLHCDDTGLLLNSPLLIQCVALLTTNT